MKKPIALLTIATLGILAMPVLAHNNSPDINRFDRMEQLLDNQRYRIRDGIKNGELTHKEARHLRKQQRHIIRLTYHFMHDGYLNRNEFRELRDKLNHANKRIYRLKHNDRNRHARYYYY